jgi:hypothetical protein
MKNLLKISNIYNYGFIGNREIKYVPNGRSNPPFLGNQNCICEKTGSGLNSGEIFFHSVQIFCLSACYLNILILI